MQLTHPLRNKRTEYQGEMDVWDAMYYLQHNDFAGVCNGKKRFYFSRHWSQIAIESGSHITTIGPGHFLQFYSYDRFYKVNTNLDNWESSDQYEANI